MANFNVRVNLITSRGAEVIWPVDIEDATDEDEAKEAAYEILDMMGIHREAIMTTQITELDY